jgi:hypothetical protein
VESSHQTVQRTASLYTKEGQAVRLELQEGLGLLRLIVYGPGNAYQPIDFPDRKSLMEYQLTYERELRDSGFQLQATAERRDGADRRAKVRGDTDRRQ